MATENIFKPQMDVERHLRVWGHLPEESCGNTDPDGMNCEQPGAEMVKDPQAAELTLTDPKPIQPRHELALQAYKDQISDTSGKAKKRLASRAARREDLGFITRPLATKPKSRSQIKRDRKKQRQNRRKSR